MPRNPEPSWRTMRTAKLRVNCRGYYNHPDGKGDFVWVELFSGSLVEVLDREKGDWTFCRYRDSEFWIETVYL